MLNKIVNITSNPGYNNSKGSTSSSPKYLLKDNSSSGTGDKIELSPALIFLKKLEWTLKEVKVSEDKYFISFEYRNFEFNTAFNPSDINSNSYIKYRIKLLSPSLLKDEKSIYDYSKLTIVLNLSIGFHRKQPGILGIITSRDSSAESFFDNEFRNSMLNLASLFERLFFVSIENVQRKPEMIEDIVEDSIKDLTGLTRINDLLILFLEKLTGEKIYPKIVTFKNKDDESLILIDAININTLT
ncbi:MAG TPA: hypothetical protein VMT35_17400 [Ignavibacteriaceae bacterium]|nr:hypothetical protein [Ignavibacteriaceae bacterium]